MSNDKTPGSDVSPKTEAVRSPKSPFTKGADYFSVKDTPVKGEEQSAPDQTSAITRSRSNTVPIVSITRVQTLGKEQEAVTETRDNAPRPGSGRRKSSVLFQPLTAPGLPQGQKRKNDGERLRASSPPAEHRYVRKLLW
jgi:hypothetical protein